MGIALQALCKIEQVMRGHWDTNRYRSAGLPAITAWHYWRAICLRGTSSRDTQCRLLYSAIWWTTWQNITRTVSIIFMGSLYANQYFRMNDTDVHEIYSCNPTNTLHQETFCIDRDKLMANYSYFRRMLPLSVKTTTVAIKKGLKMSLNCRVGDLCDWKHIPRIRTAWHLWMYFSNNEMVVAAILLTQFKNENV